MEKDEREDLIKLKEEFFERETAQHDCVKKFQSLGCRYRLADETLCGHSRHMTPKYPQHVPVAPICNPTVCPRN